MKSKIAFIVSTTHWDREWYWPQEKFRIRLIDLIDNLLKIFDEIPGYRSYMLDGQTIPIEDYLEIKPWNESKLIQLVRDGRLIIGPWYILPDAFLVSSESLIRNLLIGNQFASKFGSVMDVGYLPDSFNHIDQMPQIMRGFNFKEFLFMRGMGKEFEKLGTEFWWEAPDGSKVFTTYLIEGYFNAGGIGFNDAFIDFQDLKPDFEVGFQKMSEMLKKMEGHYDSDVFLFFNGSDHTTPQKEIPEILDFFNEKFPDVHFKHSTLREYLDERIIPENIPTYKGELTGNIHHLNVRSVYSSRMYLKQNNYHCQSLLEKYSEQLSTISYIEGLSDFSANMNYAWKTLLKNHPHDSISGCSTDEVHEDMMNRYEHIKQIGNYITENSLLSLSKIIDTASLDGDPIIVYNPLNWEREEVLSGKIKLDKFDSENLLTDKLNGLFILVDSNGFSVPFEILRIYEENSIELNNWKKFKICEIEFLAHIPANGYSLYYLQQVKSIPVKSQLKLSANSIENEYYKITVQKNGSLKIFDKYLKTTYYNFNHFEDTEDDGDEYTYSFVENSKTLNTLNSVANISIFQKNILSSTLKVEIVFKIPESIDPSRIKRGKKLSNNKITSYITLKQNCNRIDIKTEIENNSKDHRLRVLFPTKFKEYNNFADGHFNVVERSKYFPEKPKERGRIEYYSTQHQSHFVTLTDGKIGVTIVNKGLPEYEIIKSDSTIAITLLRSIGWLNKNNLMTRWRMAGPDIETPDAQCIGKNIFEYSIILHNKSWENIYKSAYNFGYPLISQSIRKHAGKLPSTMSFLQLKPSDLILSALKISEKKDGIILRFYNIKPFDINGEISFYRKIEKCYITDFLENIISEVEISDTIIKLVIPKNKIVTLLLILQ